MKRDTFSSLLRLHNARHGVENGVNGLVCAFCGKEKAGEIKFIIGYNPKDSDPDWVMIAGSGKMACPECYAAHEKWTDPKPEKIGG
jgi:hypothetical protein